MAYDRYLRLRAIKYTGQGLTLAQTAGVFKVNIKKASLFEDWFEDALLTNLPKEHVIIMDNAALYKKEVLQNLAGKYSQELIFLPPYSPEYKSIEHTWSALKRKIVGCVHLYASVSQALDAVLEGN